MALDKRNRVNDEIDVAEVRLISFDGENLGVMTTEAARQMAKDQTMDLVELVPGAEPPVCRVMDLGKYIFEQNKRRSAAKKKQKQIQVKEVKFRPGT
ncbi:MAG: translation initiation factor IF-3, partial [Gammaproteobacteria bacterium]|nr:translation initiation factor IF-3 [Gammaproteobacteria bacterium]